MQRFFLDIVPYSLNNYRNALHMRLYKIKRDIGESVHWQLLAQKARVCTGPVEITFLFGWPNKEIHDLDNYVATAKICLDSLTPPSFGKNYGVGIIPDDSTKFIKKLTFMEGEKCGVELIINEI